MNLCIDTDKLSSWDTRETSVPENIVIGNKIGMGEKGHMSTSTVGGQAPCSETVLMATSRSRKELLPLPASFKPTPFSVILGRGKGCYNNPGNKHCRGIIRGHLEQYNSVDNRFEKALVVKNVFNIIKQACPGGAFIKRVNGLWCEVDDKTARGKLMVMFRDCQNAEVRRTSKDEKQNPNLRRKQYLKNIKKEEESSQGDSAMDELAEISLAALLSINFSSKEEAEEASVSSGCGSFYDVDSCSRCSI